MDSVDTNARFVLILEKETVKFSFEVFDMDNEGILPFIDT